MLALAASGAADGFLPVALSFAGLLAAGAAFAWLRPLRVPAGRP